jgi:hypothetical protein
MGSKPLEILPARTREALHDRHNRPGVRDDYDVSPIARNIFSNYFRKCDARPRAEANTPLATGAFAEAVPGDPRAVTRIIFHFIGSFSLKHAEIHLPQAGEQNAPRIWKFYLRGLHRANRGTRVDKRNRRKNTAFRRREYAFTAKRLINRAYVTSSEVPGRLTMAHEDNFHIYQLQFHFFISSFSISAKNPSK